MKRALVVAVGLLLVAPGCATVRPAQLFGSGGPGQPAVDPPAVEGLELPPLGDPDAGDCGAATEVMVGQVARCSGVAYSLTEAEWLDAHVGRLGQALQALDLEWNGRRLDRQGALAIVRDVEIKLREARAAQPRHGLVGAGLGAAAALMAVLAVALGLSAPGGP